jgi:CheY-like chemotaxis protein
MDIHMPVMDGLEAAPRITKLNTGAPIVAMTANIMSSDKELYEICGMVDCVGKPFTTQELWRCLIKYLKPVSREELAAVDLYEEEYRKSLQTTFVTENRNVADDFNNAIASGDTATAHKIAHKLKSSSGLIGRNELSEAAAAAEMFLKEGAEDLNEAVITAFVNELIYTLNDLSYLLQEHKADENAAASHSSPALTKAEVIKLIMETEPLLKQGNPEVLNKIPNLMRIAGYAPSSAEHVTVMIEQIKNYDFDDAIYTFEKIKSHLTAEDGE